MLPLVAEGLAPAAFPKKAGLDADFPAALGTGVLTAIGSYGREFLECPSGIPQGSESPRGKNAQNGEISALEPPKDIRAL